MVAKYWTKIQLELFEGWGDVDNDRSNENYPSLLLEVGVPILSLKHCQQLFENWKVGIEYMYKGRIFSGNICAGAKPGKDSCTVSFISIFSLLINIFCGGKNLWYVRNVFKKSLNFQMFHPKRLQDKSCKGSPSCSNRLLF